MLVTPVDQAVVDLVGDYQQVILLRQIGNLLHAFAGHNRAGRVIRVGDQQGFGLGSD